MSLLRFEETYTPGFPDSIPGDIEAFIRRTPLLKRFTKYLKRHLILRLTGQLSLETGTKTCKTHSLGQPLLPKSGRHPDGPGWTSIIGRI